MDSLRHFQAIKRIFDNGIDDELTNQHDDKENFRFINSLLDDDDIILSKNKSNLILKENKWKN